MRAPALAAYRDRVWLTLVSPEGKLLLHIHNGSDWSFPQSDSLGWEVDDGVTMAEHDGLLRRVVRGRDNHVYTSTSDGGFASSRHEVLARRVFGSRPGVRWDRVLDGLSPGVSLVQARADHARRAFGSVPEQLLPAPGKVRRDDSAQCMIVDVTGIDTTWADGELERFVGLAMSRVTPTTRVHAWTSTQEPDDAFRPPEEHLVESAHVVEQILDVVLPRWRSEVPDDDNDVVNRWCQHYEAALRARIALRRDTEVRAKLGDTAPRLSASRLHPWVWEPARPLWRNGHYRSAVLTAAVSVNDETQKKVGRNDVSEKDLFNECFVVKDPLPGKSRLLIVPNDGSPTFRSIQEGARAFAEGCYRAIRNPLSHVTGPEPSEDEALEQLAVFSRLARWVDQAKVLKAT
ncbi:TIGR02391 family protein [Embleya sp. NPDC008237]|uniref:TIGR02391 family protein n=1 Tax=Embleya sp. NPDC008237 TaxID=3363978 RepID=UPI0036E477BF